jgi:hypothetical protein
MSEGQQIRLESGADGHSPDERRPLAVALGRAHAVALWRFSQSLWRGKRYVSLQNVCGAHPLPGGVLNVYWHYRRRRPIGGT